MNLINMITTTSSDVAVGGIIPLTTIARRTGCVVQGGTNSVQLRKSGYYQVVGTITFSASAAGTDVISLYNNGVAVQGASASTTTTTTATTFTVPINAIVRVYCNEQASLTLVNSGVAITVSNVDLSVVYLNA